MWVGYEGPLDVVNKMGGNSVSGQSTELFAALQGVYQALEPLDPQERKKVLESISTLMEINQTGEPSRGEGALHPRPTPAATEEEPSRGGTRPLSLIELIQERKPSTNAEYIALFAYYREKVEGITRFSRADLRDYFSKAKLAPPGNFDRDFNGTVKKGWIHEDGAESYLTSKGIEAVESAFASVTNSPSREPRKRKTPGKKTTRARSASRKATPRKNPKRR